MKKLAEDEGRELREKPYGKQNQHARNNVCKKDAEITEYVYKQREADLDQIIHEEKLKPEETRKFLENAFREGEVKTVGTDIDKLMPPISRFGGGNRAKKKQTIIEKLKAFFEKYFGIGSSFKTDVAVDKSE